MRFLSYLRFSIRRSARHGALAVESYLTPSNLAMSSRFTLSVNYGSLPRRAPQRTYGLWMAAAAVSMRSSGKLIATIRNSHQDGFQIRRIFRFFLSSPTCPARQAYGVCMAGRPTKLTREARQIVLENLRNALGALGSITWPQALPMASCPRSSSAPSGPGARLDATSCGRAVGARFVCSESGPGHALGTFEAGSHAFEVTGTPWGNQPPTITAASTSGSGLATGSYCSRAPANCVG
jgi:hypothetical protein